MNNVFERALTLVTVLAAVTVAVSAVHNEFGAREQRSAARPDYIKSWHDAVRIGHAVGGDSTAPVTVVAVVDLQCPVCAGFHRTLQQLIRKHRGAVRVVYVSYPLSYHPFALPAARGAECAAQQGRFGEWTDIVFAQRDSLGLKDWQRYARGAGVADLSRFSRCMQDTTQQPLIAAGQVFGDKIHVEGTPTVIINGWRYHRTPSLATLDSAVAVLRRGGHPG